MVRLIVGILFLSLSYYLPFESTELNTIVNIDIFPDFVGFLIIWFGLEKASSINRWFKDCSALASGMLAVTFIGFLSQINFLFPSFDYGDSELFKKVFSYISVGYDFISPAISAVTMFFFGFLARGFGLEMENKKKAFLVTVFYIFAIMYIGLTIYCVVNQFISLPIEIWMMAVPVNLAFLVFAWVAGKSIDID